MDSKLAKSVHSCISLDDSHLSGMTQITMPCGILYNLPSNLQNPTAPSSVSFGNCRLYRPQKRGLKPGSSHCTATQQKNRNKAAS